MRLKTVQQSDKMLDAAGHLFGARRFHEVRMEDIAAEAGVGKGTLYRYFNDKEELYLALLRRASQQFFERLSREVAAERGARHQLEAAVAGLLDFFDSNPHILDLIQRAEVSLGSGPEFPWHSTRQQLNQLVTDLFEAGRREGAFEVADPETSALMLLGGLRGLIRFGPKPRPEGIARQLVESFLHGACRPACRSRLAAVETAG